MNEDKENSVLSSAIKEKEPLSLELQIYLQKLEGIKISFPNIMRFYLKRIHKDTNGFLKFLKSQETVKRGDKIGYKIKMDDYFHFTHIVDSVQRDNLTIDTLSQGFIISLVSQYDAFIGKLLKWIYLNKPELLNLSEKYISYPELIKFKSFEEAKESIIEKEVENFLRESHSKQIKYLENLLKITLTKDLDIWPDFIELTERRNLFVHANGIISRQYLSICSEHNVRLENSKIGTQLSCTPQYIEKAYYILFELAFKLSQVIRRKLLPDKIDQADENVINTSFNLLLKEEYDLVIKLLSFFCYGIKKHSDEKARITMIVNYAIAHIEKGNKEKIDEILNAEDWSIVSNEYQMAYLTLKGKFKEVAGLMIKLGDNSKITRIEYLVWPLFKKFRKSRYFRNAFKKVFNQEYVTIRKTDEFKILSNHIKV